MNAVRVTAEAYSKLVTDCRVFFNQVAFTELNKDKVDEVHYLIIYQGNSARFGLILGQKGNLAKCPFSAPYSYPVEIRAGEKIASYDEALSALEAYCREQGIEEIRITFPPLFYDEHILSSWISAFYRQGYQPTNVDLNYSVCMREKKYTTAGYFDKKARSHMRKAQEAGVQVLLCECEEDIRTAYEVVQANHSAKNRPTHLSFEQLQQTFRLVNHWVFLAQLDGKGIAAMIFYQTAADTVQSIYSGYLLEYTNTGAMNLLTDHACQFFSDMGFAYLDRATATEDSIPNYGLCDFKDSVGCKRSLKYSFRKVFAG